MGMLDVSAGTRSHRQMTPAARDSSYTTPDGLELYYKEFPGPADCDLPPVLCVPGLTRNHRDFDALAMHLAEARRVFCPDLRGRGNSAYDPDPTRYVSATYADDLIALLDDSELPRVAIVGTSLGGLLAMLLAAIHRSRLDRVVLNDVGPEIDPKGLSRIQSYVGKNPPVQTWAEAGTAARKLYGLSMPGLSDEAWVAFARQGSARGEDGLIRPDYDPRISDAAGDSGAAAPDLWPIWGALADLPTLALRGETSDILSVETFDRMAREKPDLIRVEVPNRGHTPRLDEPESLAAIDAFLG